MNYGTTVFAQLMEFVPAYEFRLFVDRYHGNYKVKSFSCRDQFLCLAFAQLTYRESLRDIETCLRAAGEKLYHMGMRSKVSRNTLAHAQRGARLENLPRLCPGADPKRQRTLPGRASRGATRSNRLCLGFHYHRSLPVAIPLGQVSKAQGSGEAPYPSRLTCQHPHHSDHHSRICPRPSTSWTRCFGNRVPST